MNQQVSVFSSNAALDDAQRMVKVLSASELVPTAFRGTEPKAFANCLIAIDIARETGMGILTVMRNLQIVEGQPSWKSAFLIEQMVRNGLKIQYEFEQRGKKNVQYWATTYADGKKTRAQKTAALDDQACRLVVTNGEDVTVGPWVSVEMAVIDGWYFRSGSKWPHMTDKMLRYGAAREFNKYYPVVFMNGVPTEDEDPIWKDDAVGAGNPVADLNSFATNPAQGANVYNDATDAIIEGEPDPTETEEDII